MGRRSECQRRCESDGSVACGNRRKTVGQGRGDGAPSARSLSACVAPRAKGFGQDPFEMKFIGAVATRIINEVKGVNRVVYDVTSKPPGAPSSRRLRA